MRVRLTRKLADRIDGVDLRGCVVGDVLELPRAQASLLIAEEWATLESAASSDHPRQQTEDYFEDWLTRAS